MTLDWLGWCANICLLVYAGCVHKYRWALLLGAMGGVLWAVKAYAAGWWDLLIIQVLLGTLQIRGYVQWKR